MKQDVTPFVLSVCNNIRKLREASDVKQVDLAQAIGVSTPTLSSIENGSDVSLVIVEKICQYFKKDISDIMPANSNTFNFNESPHSTANGNYNNFIDKNLVDMLKANLDRKNEQIATLIEKLK